MTNIDFELIQGDTFKSEWFMLTDENNVIVDLSLLIIKWGMKKSYDSNYVANHPANVQKNTTTTIVDGVSYLPNKLFRLEMSSADTLNLTDNCNNETYLYDLQLTDESNAITTLSNGKIKVIRQIVTN